MFEDPTVGPTRPGMAEQRAGERADFSPAMVPNQGTMPGVFGNFPNAPGPMQPYTPDMTFSMPTGGMEVGGAGMAAESGAGATAGAAGSGLASGLGSLTSLGVGMIPGLIGGAAGADPTTMALLNTGGALAAPAAGGAVTGAVSGTGAAAGASAATAAAAPAAMIVGPYLVAALIQGIHAGMDKENLSELKTRVQNIYGQLPGELSELARIPGVAQQLTRQTSPDQAAAILKDLNSIQRGFSDQGWESHMKTGHTGVKTVSTGDAGYSMPDVQKSLMDATAKTFPQLNIARLRGQDLLEKSGWDQAKIQEQTGWYGKPQDFAAMLGAQSYNSSEAGNLGSGGGPNSLRFNQYLQDNYRPNAPEMNVGPADMEADRMREFQRTGGWSPEAFDAFGSIQPGSTEQGLNKLFGGQFAESYMGQGLGEGLPIGAMPGGGAEAGGAGKRSPQFLTPELDNRSEAGTGKLGGGRQAQADQGTPFGMGPAKRGGGMQVGGPQRGGRPGGGPPFGGMARQTMMPQQGGGVQAQRKQPGGVV